MLASWDSHLEAIRHCFLVWTAVSVSNWQTTISPRFIHALAVHREQKAKCSLWNIKICVIYWFIYNWYSWDDVQETVVIFVMMFCCTVHGLLHTYTYIPHRCYTCIYLKLQYVVVSCRLRTVFLISFCSCLCSRFIDVSVIDLKADSSIKFLLISVCVKSELVLTMTC